MIVLKNEILRHAIGNRWRTFAGVPYDDFIDCVESTLNELEWEGEGSSDLLTSGEETIFGSNKAMSYQVKDGELTIRCISVSIDPVMKGVMSLLSSKNTIDHYKDSNTIIDISPINSDTQAETAEFIQQLLIELHKPPWKFNHPRFDLAIFLRYKVKYYWKYWI